MYETRPGDAEALWAKAFSVAGRQPEAVRHLCLAFEMWRSDPWAPPSLTGATLRTAFDLAGTADRKTARALYAALREPFCVMQANEMRLTTALRLARAAAASENDPIIADALSLYGPHLPWEKEPLELHALSLREAHRDLAVEAEMEVLDYRKAEAEPFSAGLKAAAGK